MLCIVSHNLLCYQSIEIDHHMSTYSMTRHYYLTGSPIQGSPIPSVPRIGLLIRIKHFLKKYGVRFSADSQQLIMLLTGL